MKTSNQNMQRKEKSVNAMMGEVEAANKSISFKNIK